LRPLRREKTSLLDDYWTPESGYLKTRCKSIGIALHSTVVFALPQRIQARPLRSYRPLATVTNAEAMQAISGGLGVNGTMMVIGAVGALTVNSLDLLGKRGSVRGWYSGTAVDSEDTLLFSQLNGIASMNEIFPLEEAQAAYDRMMSGKARFRVVLKIDS
jgi:D-arabinose 1-dehydrogenase-like Zn-dependent alcohol dehydrogenase